MNNQFIQGVILAGIAPLPLIPSVYGKRKWETKRKLLGQ